MRFKVFPYKQGSKSAKMLSLFLGGKVLKIANSTYRPRYGDCVVNYGSSNFPIFYPATTLNPSVGIATCKKASLMALDAAGVNVPDFRTRKEEVLGLVEGIAPLPFPVVCRTRLQGHGGDGIVIATNAEELVDAPLYTRYVKKQDEYRVHVCKGKTFFIQRKARRKDVENPDWKIRNLAGGFIFVKANLDEVPASVVNEAVEAVSALKLDFGGVDVIWNNKEQLAYVLEVNTACGLEERTAEAYSQAIRDSFRPEGGLP